MKNLKALTIIASISAAFAFSCKKDAPSEAASTPPETEEAAKTEETAKTETEAAATPDSMAVIDGMIAECDKSTEARAARQAEKPLYERLGGRDGLLAFTKRVLELHQENPPIKAMFEGPDLDKLANHFVDYVGAGTGGPETYTGRGMAELHHPMNLTADQVLAAGGDIMKVLAEFKVPENESEEVMCLILAHKDALIKPAS